MIDRDKVIELAKKSGATMVFTWSEPPKVDGMDVMLFTKLFIEEVLNADRDNLRDGGSHSNPKPEGTDSLPDEGTGATTSDVQLRPARKRKTNKKDAEEHEAGA